MLINTLRTFQVFCIENGLMREVVDSQYYPVPFARVPYTISLINHSYRFDIPDEPFQLM